MNNNIDKKTVKRGLLPYLFISLIIIGIFYFVNVMNTNVKVLTYNEVKNLSLLEINFL